MRRFSLFAALIAFALPAAASAQVGVGLRASTTGLGAELAVALMPDHFTLRAVGSGFQYGFDGTEDGIDYEFDLELLNGGAFLDWHPFGGGFRFSGGAYYNENQIIANARPAQDFAIGGLSFTPDEVGNFNGVVNFNEFAPYAGIGFGNPVDKAGRVTFLFDVGLIYQGEPQVSLSTEGGLLSDDPLLLDEIAQEEAALQDDLSEFQYYPLVSVGLAVRF